MKSDLQFHDVLGDMMKQKKVKKVRKCKGKKSKAKFNFYAF